MASKRDELGRGERFLPGVWRLRLPLPWPGVPHCNAWALASGDGIVLFDTGYASEEGTRQLSYALAQVGFALEDVQLVVCTHAHSDHYGLAGPILDAAGCELWMHPAWDHVRAMAEDPDGALKRRIEVARQSGVPIAALERYQESRKGQGSGIARAVVPDRELLSGVQVETDHGSWSVHETPGHAPSHVCLHQPESGLFISGDHLLGRISLFFDYGHTPDPVGEFLGGLDEIDKIEHTTLCLAGHGRPFRDVKAKIAGNRAEVAEQMGRVRDAIGDELRSAFDIVPELMGRENLSASSAPWGIQMALAYLDHLTIEGELIRDDDGDVHRWRSV
ncbi:MAG: MBL fold metallo-hydrolase [Actinomycetota bacterium]|nr:MBL fold metallo-hydrolase [Actinomycetota bacterium]